MTPNQVEVGVDEAGRGCLFGPVVVAAAIMPPEQHHYQNFTRKLNDSKKIGNHQNRLELRRHIEQIAIEYHIEFAHADEVDRLNVLQATVAAMHRCLHKFQHKFDSILVDGSYFRPFDDVPYNCITQGDSMFVSIAAASILAKTERDNYMMSWAKNYPDVLSKYDIEHNKGYPQLTHMNAVDQFGITTEHRLSFNPVYQASLKFPDISVIPRPPHNV